MRAGGLRGGGRGRRGARRPATSEPGRARPQPADSRGSAARAEGAESSSPAACSCEFEIRTGVGRHLEKLSAAPPAPRGHRPLPSEVPPGRRGAVRGAPRRAPARAHPAPDSLAAAPPPRPGGVRAPPAAARARAPLPGAGGVFPPRGAAGQSCLGPSGGTGGAGRCSATPRRPVLSSCPQG